MSKLASLDDNESSLLQLGNCVAPPVCRPTTSAYMSIRHMEDLKKIRPVISFLIENYDDIFTFDLHPQQQQGGAVDSLAFSLSSSMLVDATCASPTKQLFNGDIGMLSPGSGSSYRGGGEQSPQSSGGERGFSRPNLLVMIPPSGPASDTNSLEDGCDLACRSQGHYYSDAEWNVSCLLVECSAVLTGCRCWRRWCSAT